MYSTRFIARRSCGRSHHPSSSSLTHRCRGARQERYLRTTGSSVTTPFFVVDTSSTFSTALPGTAFSGTRTGSS